MNGMKKASLATVLAGVASFACAHSLDIQIEPVGQHSDTRIRIRVTNQGQEMVRILSWYLAQDAELQSDVFDVSVDGGRVLYTGPIAKRAAPTEKDYIDLASGATITQTVDLSAFYDMTQAGIYQVHYDVNASGVIRGMSKLKVSRPVSKQTELQHLKSNDISVWAAGIHFQHHMLSQIQTAELNVNQAVNYVGNCSNSQKFIIKNAVIAARKAGQDAGKYLDENWQPDERLSRYKTWFGDYSAIRYAKVADHFHLVSDALNNKRITADCACKDSLAGTYAYVYRTQPYHVHLCRAFWKTSLTGRDSRSGTFIHEMSHFNVTGGTHDYAYGQYRAKRLAITAPDQAIMNADNHEYFAENTPFIQ